MISFLRLAGIEIPSVTVALGTRAEMVIPPSRACLLVREHTKRHIEMMIFSYSWEETFATSILVVPVGTADVSLLFTA
jgi:hypothetical protein